MTRNSIFRVVALSTTLLALAACGGGGGTGSGSGGGGGSGSGSGGGGGGTSSYTVGGSVSGLTGTGLVLQNNGGNDLTVGANGSFTFSTPVASGANYSVTVSAQPSGQTCAVSSGSGTVSNAAVSNVSVSCRAQVGKFLYVANRDSNDIYSYSINASTGAVTAFGQPVTTDLAPMFVAVDRSGKFLYVSNAGSSSSQPSISGFTINGTTGALTQNAGSPYPLSVSVPPPNGPANLTPAVIDNATKFGYVNNRSNHTIYGGRIDPNTGDLTEIPGMPMSVGLILGFSMLDATGKYLYVPYTDITSGTLTGYVAAFQINATTGELTSLGSPIPTGGATPVFAERDPSSKFLFVLNQAKVGGSAGGSVAVFAIDPNSGTLAAVAGSPFDVGGPALIASFHPTKSFVYVLASPASSNGSLVIFQMDTTTGVLTPTGAPSTTVGMGPGFPLVEPTGKFLIIPNRDSNNIQSFSIDQTSGALTEVAGSPLTTEQKPSPLAPDPSWRYFYGVNAGSNTLSSYSLNSTTGALTLVNTVPTGMSPNFVGLAGRQ